MHNTPNIASISLPQDPKCCQTGSANQYLTKTTENWLATVLRLEGHGKFDCVCVCVCVCVSVPAVTVDATNTKTLKLTCSIRFYHGF